MITFTDVARRKVMALLAGEDRVGLALRLAIDGRGGGSFRYQLGFVSPDERVATDTVVDAGGFQVLIDATSAPDLAGTSIDYLESLQESGFKIDNPNSPWKDALSAAVARVIEQEINPAIASHGGVVTLFEVRDRVAYLRMGGGCQGCGMATVTLREGIEVRLRQAVPELEAIVDVTDHARGAAPYYPGADGPSALG